ncbi:ARABIDOPSIS THALIANA KUNITZ TRYPSIN INHIBITOR 5 [Hibiscus trionum]|uniref:ARABIDOPSIS THALIANA KUNITZ TRYPSIN INHIBITOR 5 n=1 Tax=Hibiscus trionum TaxID=183268 RepID=A0A9W7MGD0_HIBTR|nr:ARABIDOPSIS THALIANA KUNITZ TRYPSIN INHIBITOR 5 [Hibiscus trionum]
MKIILATIALHFFIFSTNSCLSWAAGAADQPVLDTDGDKVLANVQYYILSAIRGAGGGGLDLGSPEDKLCPKFVVQDPFENGTPVLFHPVNTSDPVVHEFTDVNIEFAPGLDAYCRSSTVWKLDDYDSSSGKWWITTDGDKGNPGPQTLTNWFKIRKSGGFGYTLGFCPTVCESCVTLCNYINKFPDGKNTRLALNKKPEGSPWVFVKASEKHSK